MNIISTFNSIRDISYKIPLKFGEEDNCCSGKSERLFNLLTKMGYTVRYRVCTFSWSSMNLPLELMNIAHEDSSTHSFLEIEIGGVWKVLDPTWDKGLKDVFHVNVWDGESDTEIAVKPIKIFTPKKSLEIMNDQSEKVINKDLEMNKKFYEAFNLWLEKKRNKS